MPTLRRPAARARAALAALLVLPAALAAQPAPPPAAPAAGAPLPPADSVVARYVAAIGGAEAVTRRGSIRSTGTFAMPGAGLRGELLLVQQPGRTAMRMTIAGFGEVVTAWDGTHAWSLNPLQGARLLDGAERAQLREDAGYAGILRASPHVAGRETVERAEFDGTPCWLVRTTYASGRTSRECYGVDDGLLVAMVQTQESAMGAVEVTTLVGGWTDFDGLRSATVMRQRMMGQEQLLRVTAVEYDRADDAAQFEMPPPVRALVPPGR